MTAAARTTRIWLVVLCAAAFLLRLGYLAASGTLARSPHATHREYVLTAQRLLDTGTITSPMYGEYSSAAPSSLMPPVYVVLTAGIYALFGVESASATLFLQTINAVATSLLILPVFGVARRLGGPRPAWIAAVLLALNPALIRYTDYLWDTGLFAAAVAITVWWCARMAETRSRPGSWIVFGGWLGGLAMLNPALTAAYPALVLWPVTRGRRLGWRGSTQAVALVVFGWILVLTPWTIRNYLHFDRLLYVRGGFQCELWIGFCPEAELGNEIIYDTHYPLKNGPARDRLLELGEQAYFDELGRKTGESIRANPVRSVRLIVRRFLDFWTANSVSSLLLPLEGWPRSAATSLAMILLTLETVLMVSLFPRALRAGPVVWWLVAAILLFSVVYALTHVVVRFRAPIEPVLAILTALGLSPPPRTPRRGSGFRAVPTTPTHELGSVRINLDP